MATSSTSVPYQPAATRDPEKDTRLRRYAIAIAQEFGLKFDPKSLKTDSLEDSPVDIRFGGDPLDSSDFHEDMSRKKHACAFMDDENFLYLYEKQGGNYRFELLSARPDIPAREFTTSELDTLVEQHRDACETLKERLARFKKEIEPLNENELSELCKSLHRKGAIVSINNIPVSIDRDSRENCEKLKLVYKEFAKRYDKVFHESDTEHLRQLLLSKRVTDGFIIQLFGDRPGIGAVISGYFLRKMHEFAVSWSRDKSIREKVWPESLERGGINLKYNELFKGYIAFCLAAKETSIRCMV